MKKAIKAVCLWFIFTGVSTFCLGQQRDYQSYAQMTNRLKRLGNQYPNLCTITTIGKTATGKEIWLITLGRDNAAKKPAIVLAAGVQATQLATVELSLQMAEQMLQAARLQDSVQQLLLSKTIYIFPNLNPDATEQYVEKLRWERPGNAQPVDDDRDGRMFEDAFEDLNNDGLITMMRVPDSTGTYRRSTVDARIMVKADTANGEKGTHLLLTEGIDNDKDGRWNEDPEGGVNFNKNFSYQFPYFQEGAGEHPMSERETKAFADFMFEARNVYAVFVLGPANTLTKPLPAAMQSQEGSPFAGLLEKDAAVNQKVSSLYNATTKLEDAPTSGPTPGDVLQWAYFHYGRYSYSTPSWWIPKVLVPRDSAAIPGVLAKGEEEDLNFLRWAAANDVVGTFVNWRQVDHPDFPGRKVEVGGFAPYVKQTPPVRLIAPLAEKHLQFLAAYAQLMPVLEITNLTIEKMVGGQTRISAEVQNTGSLPTHAAIGERSRWVNKVKVGIQLAEGQTLVSGKNLYLHEAIAGGNKINVTWIVAGKGFVAVEASSPMVGTQKREIFLR